MRFVHIADIHVGMGFSTASFGAEKGKERRQEIKETLLRVVAYCEETQVDLLLIAGDLFEEDYVSISELKDLNGAFGRLTHTKVLMSAGNHDPIVDKNSLYAMMDWCEQVYIFDTSMESLYIEQLNTEVWSFSWDKKDLPPLEVGGGLSLSEERNNLMMLHGDVYQENEYLYIDKKILKPFGFDYVALGHIHKKDFIESWMAYPGSLEALDFSEGGDHGFIEGEIIEGKLITAFKPFGKRTFQKLDVQVDGHMTFEDIAALIGQTMMSKSADDFFRVRLIGDIDPEVDLDLNQLKERFQAQCYYFELRDQTQLDMDLDQLEKDYEGTLIGAYIRAMKAKGLEDPVVAEALKKGLRILLEEQVQL